MLVRVIVADDPLKREATEITLDDETTVSQLRERLSSGLEGHPAPDSMRIIVQGRALGLARGGEKLRDVLAEIDQHTDAPTRSHVVHLVVPKEGWTSLPEATNTVPDTTVLEPTKTVPDPMSTPPNRQPPPSVQHPLQRSPAGERSSAGAAKAQDWSEPWPAITEQFKQLEAVDAYVFKGRLITAKAYLCAQLKPLLAALNIASTEFEAMVTVFEGRFAERKAFDADMEQSIETLVSELNLESLVQDFVGMAESDAKDAAPDAAAAILDQYRAARRYQALLSILESLDLLLLQGVLKEVPRTYTYNFNLYTKDAQRRSLRFTPNGPDYRSGPHPPGFEARRAAGMAATAAARAAVAANPPPAGAGMVIPPGIAAAQPPRPRANALAVVINLDELRRTLIPLFWLAFKLSFLLYIFGRHASQRKRVVLACMALGWIAWEGWTMRARRAAQGRRIQQQQQQAQVQQQAQPNQQPAAFAAGGAQWEGLRPGVIIQRARRQQARVPGRPQVQAGIGEVHPNQQQVNDRRRTPPAPRNLLSPSFWINSLASVGLTAEARQLGLTGVKRTPTGELRVSRHPSPVRPQTQLQRWGQTMMIGLVLFVGTLIPEVERKRKRAIEKRDRLVKEVREMRAKMAQDEADRLAAQAREDMQQSQNEPAASQPAPLLRVDTAQSAPASALPSPGLRNDHILEPDEGDFDAADPDNEVGTPPLPVQLDGGEAPNAPAAAAQNDMRAHARLLNQQIEAELAREQDPPAERVDGAERIMVQDFANEDEPRPEAPIDEVGVVLF